MNEFNAACQFNIREQKEIALPLIIPVFAIYGLGTLVNNFSRPDTANCGSMSKQPGREFLKVPMA
jgi:hypothetical protein